MGFAVGPGPYYPCQTCLPQEHCTVSVGAFFVSCCLQTGHGLVITYVISLRLLLKIGHPCNMHVSYHKQVLLQHSLFKAGKCRGSTRAKFGNSVCGQSQRP
jgi:hypothetical protein